jgi:hypothetical protein
MPQPVVLIHTGNHSYLKLSIEQARSYHNDVVVLGDEANLATCLDSKVTHRDLSIYRSEWGARFEALYTHMSTNTVGFEKFCFSRWFILLEYMIQEGITSVCYTDSDVMLYMNVTNNTASNDHPYAYVIPMQDYASYRWDASAHVSFWTLEGLREFCSFILDTYEYGQSELLEKWQYHQAHKIPGGICDMTLLYLFSVKMKEAIRNLCTVDGSNLTFDNNVRQRANWKENEYDLRPFKHLQIKKVSFQGQQLLAFNKLLDKEVQLGNLHFQGAAKRLMFDFFKGHLPAGSFLTYYIQSVFYFTGGWKSKIKARIKKMMRP